MPQRAPEVTVTPDQIIAARILIKRKRGDLTLVPPHVVTTAKLSLSDAFEPRRNEPLSKELIRAAKFLAKYFGGKRHVDPVLVAIARSKPGDPLPIP